MIEQNPMRSNFYTNYELGNGLYACQGEIHTRRVHTDDEISKMRDDLLKALQDITK